VPAVSTAGVKWPAAAASASWAVRYSSSRVFYFIIPPVGEVPSATWVSCSISCMTARRLSLRAGTGVPGAMRECSTRQTGAQTDAFRSWLCYYKNIV